MAAKKAKKKQPVIHSNYEIRWRNFRRFKDTGWITIRPVTIIIGANNSGKSSILSPLLLMNQTIASPDNEAALIARGKLVDLGGYRDFVCDHDKSNELFFGLRFHCHKLPKKVDPVGRYPPGSIEASFRWNDSRQKIELAKFEVLDIFNRPYFRRVKRKSGSYSLAGTISAAKMTGFERKAVLASQPTNFMFTPSATLAKLEEPETQAREKKADVKSFSKDFSHYLRAVSFTFSEVSSLFQNLSYIGPLRRRIERLYRVSSEAKRTVGPQGENAANIFRQKQSDIGAEVNAWVKRFEFGDAIECRQLADDVFQLLLRSGNALTNLADVGFGASQVLPLIIQALTTPTDSLTVAEQPEIHLNPKLQSVLADLFVAMAEAGHRVLVETHSEHMLTRLRTLVAEGSIDASNVAIYFVEKEGDESTIREVPINAKGHIERDSWPSGFFDDALRQSLALAAAQAKVKS